MFQFSAKVLLEDTDAAGILFFANYIKRAHQVYEEFMESIDYSLRQVIHEEPNLLLIAHAKADYKRSLQLGDSYRVKLTVTKLGHTSFTLQYQFDSNDDDIAVVETVHVCVDKKSKRPVELPIRLRHSLELHT